MRKNNSEPNEIKLANAVESPLDDVIYLLNLLDSGVSILEAVKRVELSNIQFKENAYA